MSTVQNSTHKTLGQLKGGIKDVLRAIHSSIRARDLRSQEHSRAFSGRRDCYCSWLEDTSHTLKPQTENSTKGLNQRYLRKYSLLRSIMLSNFVHKNTHVLVVDIYHVGVRMCHVEPKSCEGGMA